MRTLLDCGLQPVSHRFLRTPRREYRHPLVAGQCGACGLVQLLSPAPAAALKPRFPWVSYLEPEGHLDRLAGRLRGLPGLGRGARALGISHKDDSLLRRLDAAGLHCRRLSPARDLAAGFHRAGVETVADRLGPARARAIARRRGRVDLIVARHVLEHARDPGRFLDALGDLLAPDGTLVLEVPDCAGGFAAQDYTTLWEEHVLYFTPATFPQAFRRAGFALQRLEIFPYALEDCLVGIGRRDAPGPPPSARSLRTETSRWSAFAAGLPRERRRVAGILRSFRARRGPVALWGAGHRGCTFVNLLRLGGLVDFVVDGRLEKRGLRLPGCLKPIGGPRSLEAAALCLLAVNPDREAALVARQRAFAAAGGRFASIYPGGPRALTAEGARR